MGLKLEVGKKYTDRTGNVRGPLRAIRNPAWHKFTDGKLSWGEYGAALSTGDQFDNDLIAPWTTEPTGPVRTVTRTTREIVPGVYGMVKVTTCPSSPLGVVGINLTSDGWWTAADIRAAIATLTEIAQALEDS